ncbi:histidine kinase [Candidatus Fermentibacteria bacterium]|nr:histidine kinase [Candidatus Fermentibacteria bacterium]
MLDNPLDRIVEKKGSEPVPFFSLMSKRVRNVLLVSSHYDSYTLEEDGSFTELLFSEYLELNLRYAPRIVRVSTAGEALDLLGREDFDLVITMLQVGEMRLREFGSKVKRTAPGIPLILLAYSARGLEHLRSAGELEFVDRAFTWRGEAKLFLAIVKCTEDRLNVAHDTWVAGVKSIILVEDSIHFASSYLPMLYTELMRQNQALMSDGVNQMQKLMRMRARPKILLADTYEEGIQLFEEYSDHLLGLIVDSRFPREGREDPHAGRKLAEIVRKKRPDCAILVQSYEGENRAWAEELNAAFINKGSPTLLNEVREFMRQQMGFGDFVFRTPKGTEEARAADLKDLCNALASVSDRSLVYHAKRNDFSTWLMARTEFELAKALRPQRVEDFESVDHLRSYLLSEVRRWLRRFKAGEVEEYSKDSFGPGTEFVRIGQGSLGGKGRGLAYMHSLMHRYRISDRFPEVRIFVPPTAVLSTDVFEDFMSDNQLYEFVFEKEREVGDDPSARDQRVTERFLRADLPGCAKDALHTFLEKVDYPIAVRSSSLLEDSPTVPYAGVYHTYMLPNDASTWQRRMVELCRAIKLVYASTYLSDSVGYMESTPNRLEDERMAVVIQRLVGRQYGDHFYPHVSGVVRSFNFYPLRGTDAEEGVASVALGLGRKVVEGGRCVRFSPRHPGRLYQASTPEKLVRSSQRKFFALKMGSDDRVDRSGEKAYLDELDLDVAERDGTLLPSASVYSPEEDRLFEGLHRNGPRVVSMAGVLQGEYFPLPEVLDFLVRAGKASFSSEVEIEFAANIEPGTNGTRGELGYLQIRPISLRDDAGRDLEDVDREDALCISDNALGSGSIENIHDIVFVDTDTFDRDASRRVAQQVGSLNARLRKDERNCILVGPGRWGSADSWLGIPVKWEQISTARCIVETSLAGVSIAPSQGTHFFQNVTSLGIGYFSLDGEESYLDTEWLRNQKPLESTEYVKLLRVEQSLSVYVDRRHNLGAIIIKGRS